MGKSDFNDITELLDALSPYISARAFARICDISESQMLQYKAGLKRVSNKNIAKINDRLSDFAMKLSEYKLIN